MGEKLGAGDFIRTYLGLMGSGKTTEALRDLEGRERVIIFSPGTSNPGLLKYPYIYDTTKYLKDWHKWLKAHPQIRFEKQSSPTPMFSLLSKVRGYTILLDDVAALKTEAQERTDFEALIRTIRFNGNQLILTTHRVRKDLPRLVTVLGTSFYYVGPGTRDKDEQKTLYELVNYPISFDDFRRRLEENPTRQGNQPAGVFTIRAVA